MFREVTEFSDVVYGIDVEWGSEEWEVKCKNVTVVIWDGSRTPIGTY